MRESLSVDARSQGRGEGLTAKGIQKHLEVTGMLCFLIMVVVSLVHTFVKTNQTVHFKRVSLLYVHYISIKLICKKTHTHTQKPCLRSYYFIVCLCSIHSNRSLGCKFLECKIQIFTSLLLLMLSTEILYWMRITNELNRSFFILENSVFKFITNYSGLLFKMQILRPYPQRF